MRKDIFYSCKSIAIAFLMLSIYTANPQKIHATINTISEVGNDNDIEKGQLILTSNSFTVQKPSKFKINGATENVERGLTIIHFNSTKKYEYKTYDTHSSEEKASAFIEMLKKLERNKANYVVFAHDSAAKSLLKFSASLKSMGFQVLSKLKSRQAYVMYNFNGKIIEKVDDQFIKIDLSIPQNIAHEATYFPKEKYEFEYNTNRYIAHAGGEVNGTKSTNTLDALNQNYEKGFRLFELDIIETSDGKYVAAHDWRMWSRFTSYDGELPVSHAEFMKHKIYNKYTTLDMDGINKWFAEHPEATLITDKVNEPVKFANQFIDKSRLIMELFSFMAIEEASQNGIATLISSKPFNRITDDKLAYLKANNIKYVAISRRGVVKKKKLMLQLKNEDIKVYVYHVNFDEGKDEKYVQENEIGLIYGMYADKWIFDEVQNVQEAK